MATLTCRHCETENDPEASRWWFCVKCGKELLEQPATRVPGPSSPSGFSRAQRDAPFVSQSGRCDLCEQRKAGADTCYLRVEKTSPGIGSVTARWINFRCCCCADCYRKGRRINWVGVFGLLFMFGLPIFLCGGGGMLMAALFRDDGIRPEGAFGIPGKKLINGFLGIASLLSLLGFFVTPFVVGMLVRRRTRRLLNNRLDEKLRSVAGVKRWGALARISLVRRIPDREPYIQLN